VSHDFVQSDEQKICERWRFTISELSCKFPQISLTVLYKNITLRLGYNKFFPSWALKMLMNAHKTQRMASTLTFLEQFHRGGNEFLNHIVRVTGDETLITFVNVETKGQSKLWVHTHSPNKPKKFKLKLMAIVFWDREGLLMVEFMQHGTTIMSEA
jgi:hypothetical protein